MKVEEVGEERWKDGPGFTRPRLVPKAGRGLEGWTERQQVRHTNTAKNNNSQKERKEPTGAFFSQHQASLRGLGGGAV